MARHKRRRSYGEVSQETALGGLLLLAGAGGAAWYFLLSDDAKLRKLQENPMYGGKLLSAAGSTIATVAGNKYLVLPQAEGNRGAFLRPDGSIVSSKRTPAEKQELLALIQATGVTSDA